MAFDHRGTLWVSDRHTNAILGLTAAQLASTGSPTPAVTDTLDIGNGFLPEQLVFDAYATSMGVSAVARSPARRLDRPHSPGKPEPGPRREAISSRTTPRQRSHGPVAAPRNRPVVSRVMGLEGIGGFSFPRDDTIRRNGTAPAMWHS